MFTITAATLLTIAGVTLSVSQWLAAAGVAGNVLSFGTEAIKIAAQLHGQQKACHCAQPPNAKVNVSWFVHPSNGQPTIYHDWVPSGDGFRAATVPPPLTMSNKDHHHGHQKASIDRRRLG